MFGKKFGNSVDPSITPHGSPQMTPCETPHRTPQGTPRGSLSRIPCKIKSRTPHGSSSGTPAAAMHGTTSSTPRESPSRTTSHLAITITSPGNKSQNSGQAMGHCILSNSWRICVSFRCFGIYPLKRIGNSELKSTTKCQFWLTYILTLVIGTGLFIGYHFNFFIPRLDSHIHECKSNASSVTEINDSHQSNLANYDVTQMYKKMIIYAAICYRFFVILPLSVLLLRRFSKELPIIQKDFNCCIDLVQKNRTASIKNISFGQYRNSKNINILMLIIPLILQMIFVFGNYLEMVPNLTISCSLAGLEIYIIIHLTTYFIINVIFSSSGLYIYVVYVDISYLFLSWSESIQNTQGIQRSTLLSQTMSFIRILNNYKKIASPVILSEIANHFIFLIICVWVLLDQLIEPIIADDITIRWWLRTISHISGFICMIFCLMVFCCLSEKVARQAQCLKEQIILATAEHTGSTNTVTLQDDSHHICSLLDEFKGFDAMGFFTINHSFLPGMFMSFVTFVVLLFQFNLIINDHVEIKMIYSQG